MKHGIGTYQTKNVSGKFWLAVGMTVLLCASSRFQGDSGSTELTVLLAYFTYSKAELLKLGESACAYQTFVGFRDMEWFVVALPLISAFPTIYDFAEQWFGGSYYQLISRKSRLRYAIENLAKSALYGFCAMTIGILVYAALISVKFPPFSAYQLNPEESMIAMSYGATALDRWSYFLKAVFHTGLLAAVSAMFCTILVIVLKDRFLAVGLPVLAEYFSIKLSGMYMNHLYNKYGFSEIPVRERMIELLMPSSHLYYSHSFQRTYGMSYGYYLILMGVVILCIFIVFWRLIERRSE